jgi:Arc/MetJ family transcription regulator
MTMTSVDVDLDKLAQAGRLLGTTTKKDTISRALDEVLRIHAAQHLMEAMQSDAIEITDPDEVRRRAWGYSADPSSGQ